MGIGASGVHDSVRPPKGLLERLLSLVVGFCAVAIGMLIQLACWAVDKLGGGKK
jgi:hypothetical protein